MAGKIDWESQIGRRIKLRDLHVFVAIVQRGSMAKAAAHLGVSQSAVSEVIADLEHAVGVRLLDRGPRGVEPTIYGRAMLERSVAAFDELKQGIRTIEFLADPEVGEVRVGCAESVAAAILPRIIQRFSQQYPRVAVQVEQLVTPTLELPELCDRSLDVVLARIVRPLAHERDDLNVEILFHDELVVAAGMQSTWDCRRKIDLVELVNEPWILTPENSWNHRILLEAFRACGLDMPRACLTTFSINLRANLLAVDRFITTFPSSVLRYNADRYSVKVLPVNLPIRPWPVAIVTLKNRTLSPVVQLFIDHVRAFTSAMGADLRLRRSPPRCAKDSIEARFLTRRPLRLDDRPDQVR
jgi:DNA-binding transcriptional LysR family regulator